ncbi:GntR family transcriptional regulator [Gryllotalpicola protaetiae]|uniref:GntR family transcriptional regulator n=1 Tax=Gryllotalpicola protaetiae TaxID=2419771 RepID=UPI001FE9943A|nr:GntR family transcriptional regulator [Gryllotalpicola protaetiae]
MPLHVVVADALRERISSGELAVGAPLPSESELGAKFGASRGPVRQALAQLRNEGLIETSQGRVPTVLGRPLAHSIDDFFSFSAWVQATGRTPGQHTIELAWRVPPADVAAKLQLAASERAVVIVRRRSIDGLPAMLERSWYISEVGRQLFDFDPDEGSIFGALIERGVALDSGTHTIDAVAADAIDAEQLDVAVGTPLLRVERLTSSAGGQLLEYADDRYRTDRAKLAIRNSRSTSAVSRPSVARLASLSPVSSEGVTA